MAPKADFCWDGRLTLLCSLLLLVYLFFGLRIKALRGYNYSTYSPRGLPGLCILAVVVLLTAYTCVFIWNYSVWWPIRDIWLRSREHKDDALLVVLQDSYPQDRKKVSFSMRMLLVTALWLVKTSFVLVYFEFSSHLPRNPRAFLYFVSCILFMSYVSCWIVTAVNMAKCLARESYSPAAGGALIQLTPLNTWAQYLGPQKMVNWGTGLLAAEIVITTLNVVTDLLLLALVFWIFHTLRVASGRHHWRALSLLIGLSSFSIALALARAGILASLMTNMQLRLTFDTATDVEVFVAACASCIPAVRVLVRDGRRQRARAMIGFADDWPGEFAVGSKLRSKFSSSRTRPTSDTAGRSGISREDWLDWEATLRDAEQSSYEYARPPSRGMTEAYGSSERPPLPEFMELPWTEHGQV